MWIARCCSPTPTCASPADDPATRHTHRAHHDPPRRRVGGGRLRRSDGGLRRHRPRRYGEIQPSVGHRLPDCHRGRRLQRCAGADAGRRIHVDVPARHAGCGAGEQAGTRRRHPDRRGPRRLVVLEVARACRRGARLEDLEQIARDAAGRVELVATLDRVATIERSGRVPAPVLAAAERGDGFSAFRFRDGSVMPLRSAGADPLAVVHDAWARTGGPDSSASCVFHAGVTRACPCARAPD